jgi:hypothetical protein
MQACARARGALETDVAMGRQLLPREQLDERRFARPVVPDQTNYAMWLQRERQRMQQRSPGHGEADAVELEHRRGHRRVRGKWQRSCSTR